MSQPALIPILMYHQIAEPPPRGTPLRGLVVAPRTFARHLRVLSMLGYQGHALHALEPYLDGSRKGRVVGISFDDGYQNNVIHALPLLQAYGHTATCYAVSQRLGGDNDWDRTLGVPPAPLMNRQELQRWQAAGMEVGSHTRTHADLTQLSHEQARSEIADSKDELEQWLQSPVRSFCYPYGRFAPAHRDLVRDAGYHSATTTQRHRARAGADPYTLPRVLVARTTTVWHLTAKLLTSYEDRARA